MIYEKINNHGAHKIEEVRSQFRAAARPLFQVEAVSDRHMLIFGRC